MDMEIYMKGFVKKLLYGGLGTTVLIASQAYASGFKLEFQSPSVLADAGEAAVVEDAGTNWYNSAGLVYLPQQFVGSAIDVYQSTTFAGQMNAPTAPGIPLPPSNFSQSGSVSSHPNSFLPAFHYSQPFRDRFAFGVTVAPAWGLQEDYGQSSALRYDLIRVTTRTLDIAPSFAMKIDDHWSFGLGPDFHYMSIDSKSNVRTQPLTPDDSRSRFTGNDWGYGAHFGVLYRFNDATRLGLNYRTKIMMNLGGDSEFTGTGIGSFETNNFNLKLPLPPVTTLSLYHDVTTCWALMGTIAYDQWSVLKRFHAENYQLAGGVVLPDVYLQQSMSNTFDISVGTHYKIDPQWMLRGSVKYEGTPTNSHYRDVNFPDGQKLGLNFGTRYQMNNKLGFDFIYAHVFTRMAHINGVNPITGATAIGHVSTAIDLIGAQVVWNI